MRGSLERCQDYPVEVGGEVYLQTWITTKGRNMPEVLRGYALVTHVHGICFDQRGRILVVRGKKGEWVLPGGFIESGESADRAFKREVVEEVNCEVGNLRPVGLHRIETSRGGSHDQFRVFYQLKVICDVLRVFEPSQDPDRGEILERLWVNGDAINSYVVWGPCSREMFADAFELWRQSSGSG